MGESAGMAQAAQRLGQPRTGHGLAPGSVGLTGSPTIRDAGSGQHAHRLGKRQAIRYGPVVVLTFIVFAEQRVGFRQIRLKEC